MENLNTVKTPHFGLHEPETYHKLEGKKDERKIISALVPLLLSKLRFLAGGETRQDILDMVILFAIT